MNIPIPSSYKTIKRAIQRSMEDDYSYMEIKCEYHPDLITPGVVEPAVGVSLCPMELLAEFLLKIDDDQIQLEKEISRDSNGLRIIHSATSTYTYEALFDKVQEVYGVDTYPLILNCNIDDMPVDGLGKRTLKPVKVQLKDLKPGLSGKHSLVMNVGYAPVHVATDCMLMKAIATRVHTYAKRNEALSYMKR